MAAETKRAAPNGVVAKFFIKVFTGAHAGLYRLSGGRLGAQVGGTPVLVLESVGRQSGQTRTTPLVYLRDGERLVVVGSAGGAERHPAWVHNLRQTPRTMVTVGPRRLAVVASEASGEERARLWQALVALFPRFGEYQWQTSREIPVVVLTPVAG